MIFEEKLREDAVRDLGLQVVRWIWRDLYRAGVLRERVLRAFARGLLTSLRINNSDLASSAADAKLE